MQHVDDRNKKVIRFFFLFQFSLYSFFCTLPREHENRMLETRVQINPYDPISYPLEF